MRVVELDLAKSKAAYEGRWDHAQGRQALIDGTG